MRQLVVAALLVDDLARPRSVLAARRSTPAALAGRWEFPGGKVEPGEQPVAALHRELLEELRVDLLVGTELPPELGTAWKISDDLELRVWWAEVASGEIRPTGSHDAVRWFRPAQLGELPWLDADRAIATLVRRRLVPAL